MDVKKTIVLCLMASLLVISGNLQAERNTPGDGKRDILAKDIPEKVHQHFRVSRYAHRSLTLPSDLPDAFSVTVEHNGDQKELYLWKHSVRSADYKVVGAKNGK